MAEAIAAIGIVASVVQLADFGFKLSVKLFTFSKAVASADTSIQDISNDVSLTSTVLSELSQILQADESHVVSENALETTRQTVKECMSIFEQLDHALDRSLRNLGILENKGKAKRGRVALEKLKWPFKQNKMELLRSNLDRLKASLALMLQVLSYAREISSRKAADSSFAYQKHLIESLARSEQETKRKYHALQMAIESENSEKGPNAFIRSLVHVTGARGMDTMSQSSETPAIPAVKHQTLIGELLLCFQLLNDVLGHHLAVSTLSELSSLGYEQLRLTASSHAKTEAVKNLEARLKELARADILEGEGKAPISIGFSIPQVAYDEDPKKKGKIQVYPSIESTPSSTRHSPKLASRPDMSLGTTTNPANRRKVAETLAAISVITEAENRKAPAVVVPPEPEVQQPGNRLAGHDQIPRKMRSMSSVGRITPYYPSPTSSYSDAVAEEGMTHLRLAEVPDDRQHESDESDFKSIDLGLDTHEDGSSVVEDLLSRWTTLSPSIY
ncbi:hypothetical protein LOCC1_G007871 [Lachnellula occidentalis]|uniref:Fungal N-terminal domain-containing protein n=1 Tax=Lachnellula occidentalis TaxID=215460 RepID=A0A8H8RBX0_9HELO|nr:hypothetical protein LOCC1_G007871 [Lachnellula occidentalis]